MAYEGEMVRRFFSLDLVIPVISYVFEDHT